MIRIISCLFILLFVNLSQAYANYLDNQEVRAALKEASYIKGAYEANGILTMLHLGVDIDEDIFFLAIDDEINNQTAIDADFARMILESYNITNRTLDLTEDELSSISQKLHQKKIDIIDIQNSSKIIISYAMGVSYTNGVFSTYNDQWDIQSEDYCFWGTRHVKYNITDVLTGFKETLRGKGRYSVEDVRANVNLYFDAVKKVRLQNDALFYDEFSTNPNTIKTASGLLYQLNENKIYNNLLTINPDDRVVVHFIGKLINGCEIINTYHQTPKTFVMKELVQGWQEALSYMNMEQRIKVVLPAELAYGENSFVSQDHKTFIDSNSMMIFEIELLKIIP